MGYVEEDGTVLSYNSSKLGYISDDGTVRNNSSSILGYANGVNKKWAAVAFFFFRLDDESNSGMIGKATGKIEVGSLVAAEINDNYYCAYIVSISGVNIEVKDLRGNKNIITESALSIIPKEGTKYLEGDKVFAVWPEDGKFYYGVVGKTDQKGAYVKWDGSSSESYVEFNRMLKAGTELDEKPITQYTNSGSFGRATGKIEVGSLVAVYFKDNYYYAYILSINGGKIEVKDLRGSRITVTEKELYPIPKQGTKFKEGDKVFAVWHRDGRFYYGVLKKTDQKGAIVKWKDILSESYVEFERMMLDGL